MTNNTEYYQDIETVSINKEKPRTSFISHDNREDAITNITDFEKTPYYINLNGKWNFTLMNTPKIFPMILPVIHSFR